jgi:hypothetical protein
VIGFGLTYLIGYDQHSPCEPLAGSEFFPRPHRGVQIAHLPGAAERPTPMMETTTRNVGADELAADGAHLGR